MARQIWIAATIALSMMSVSPMAFSEESKPAEQQPVATQAQEKPAEQPVEQSSAATEQQSAQTVTEPVKGQVSTTQAAPASDAAQAIRAAATAADYLDIQFKPGESKHKMQQFNLTLNNKQPKHLEVLQVEVLNGVSEQAYLQLQQEKSQAKRRMAGGLLRGVTGIATSFVPYAGIGSVAAWQGIHAASTVANVAATTVENSAGGVDYTGRIVQRASNIMITPNQQFQCLAVVPEKQTPIVKVIFKDLQSNQIFDLQK